METLRVGVIGGGQIAESAHLPNYADNEQTRVVALAELDSNRRETLSKQYDIDRTYADGESLLASEELDIVSICTPPSTHEVLFLDAAERGIDVYCEKPLTTDLSSAKAIQKAVEDAGIVAQLGYSYRYMGNFRRVLSMASNELLGDLLRAETTIHTPSPAKGWYTDGTVAGGGVARDKLPHVLDFYVSLCGESLSVERSQGRNVRTTAVEDSAEIDLVAGETRINLSLGWMHDRWYQQHTLVGTGGVLEFDQERLTGNVGGNGVYYKYGQLPTIQLGSLYQQWFGVSEDYEKKRIDDFIEHAVANDPETRVPVERGVKVTELIEEVYDAMEWSE